MRLANGERRRPSAESLDKLTFEMETTQDCELESRDRHCIR